MKTFLAFFLLLSTLITNAQNKTGKDSTGTLQTIDRGSYKLQYPSTWRSDTVTAKTVGADLFIFSQKESETDKFVENVNIMVQDLAGLDINLDKFVEISEGQIKQMITKSNILESKRVNEAGKVFHKMVFTGMQGAFDLKIEQYYFVVEEKAYIVTFTAENNQFDNYKKAGEIILNSFKIKA